jgi:hypothetical protein
VRARARASLALGSALACAVITSTLLLSGSVRALRAASSAGVGRGDTQFVGEAALHEAPTVQRQTGGDVTRCSTASRSDAASAWGAGRACEIAPSRASQPSSIVAGSRGADIARGYDATAPPRGRS